MNDNNKPHGHDKNPTMKEGKCETCECKCDCKDCDCNCGCNCGCDETILEEEEE